MDLNPCGDNVSTTGIQLSCMSNKGQLLYIQKFTIHITNKYNIYIYLDFCVCISYLGSNTILQMVQPIYCTRRGITLPKLYEL